MEKIGRAIEIARGNMSEREIKRKLGDDYTDY